MDPSDAIQLAATVVMIMLSAFFSSAETAMTTINKIRIFSLSEQGNTKAILLLKIIEDPGKLLSTILIGNNIVNITASSLVTTFTIRKFGSTAVGIATGVLTLVILICGEITPKTMATIHAEKIALTYAHPVYGLMFLLTPVIFLVNKLALGILTLLRVDPNKKAPSMTEHELRTIVDVSHEEGVIKQEEKQMIYNVFDFGDAQAKDVMIPRIDMTFLNITSTYEELMAIHQEYNYTRYPVYEETTDSVIGTINVKDLLFYKTNGDFSIHNFLREPYFTYEHKNTASLFIEMREKSINFAIVLDEYGATAGLITMEDLLEEIVGEIRDEYDEEEEEILTTVVDGRECIALGSAKLDDINEKLHLSLISDEYDSIGGYIIEQLDRIPELNEEIQLEDQTRLVVDQLTKNRIELVHIYLPEPDTKDNSVQH